MAHLQRIAFAVLCFIVGLSPTVISFVLFICTGYADSKQRSRWVSTRHVLLRARPKKSQALDGPRVRKEVKYLIIKMFNLLFFYIYYSLSGGRIFRTTAIKNALRKTNNQQQPTFPQMNRLAVIKNFTTFAKMLHNDKVD